MRADVTHRSSCRICQGAKLRRILSLGPTPLANAFLREEEKHLPERYFPLDVYLCKDCSLVQLLDVVDPRVLFKDYVYVSSTSPVFVAHFADFAQKVFTRFSLNEDSLVIDIGSNDGILLRPFKKLGARVLGVEPDRSIGATARKAGVETLTSFFSLDVAKKILKKYGDADIITATNVFAHVDDIHGLVQGVRHLLSKNGVFIIEVPYLVDFLEKNLFDTVYHEHLSYFSVTALKAFFDKVGMTITHVEKVPTHGGSLRVFSAKTSSVHTASPSVRAFLAKEKKLKLKDEKVYDAYRKRIEGNKVTLLALLQKLREQGKTIAGYGAPAKGNTLLNFFAIGNDTLTFIIDDNPLKQGRYTPGKRIPVVSSDMLRTDPPDYLLIIAWNFAESIIKKNEAFKKSGGKFIVPVPDPRIL